ncbi:Pyrroline-5-carboxylate reductase [Marinomonas aquimarina]|uniref:Pyrroline-5-carboxylate reductase n=1 Tax=Marinomonas aquimarina TaxID=295068 RepID=A0A1A8TE52_9GAMM|nr:pyrroline-5-carboxylate reductase dimerization domain-containing protein [Marinomonas aquimarina]SBS30658.1 Pyrroline-5-carboxylate reductase [Marinomonas aquimarina]
MTATQHTTIGIIGGLGWLGSALMNAALDHPPLEQVRFVVSSRRPAPQGLPERVSFTHDNQTLVDASDLIVLSIRPQDWAELALDMTGKTLISFMAGVPSNDLQARHTPSHLIRALPNGACSVKQSYTPWYANKELDPALECLIRNLLESFGYQDRYETEDHIDVLTAISGAGPGYPALLAQALEQSAIGLGLPADKARRAVNATLKGSGHLIEDLTQSPEQTVTLLESYQGTTAAGLSQMKASGYTQIVESGVRAAYQKALNFQSSED